jgi:osmoprotectant transport system substrate-binding protein
MRMNRTLALGAASLVLVMSACTPGGSSASPSGSAAASKPTVKVGSQAFWEAAVVGEMYAQALEAKGYTVERHLEISPEHAPVHAALKAGEINLTPEYLGGMGGELGLDELSPDATEAVANLQEALAAKGWVIFDPSPGTDADGFAVSAETAADRGLATMSDLADPANDDLVWGIAAGCPTNPVCGPGLKEVYGIDLDQLAEAGQVETDLDACSADIAGNVADDTIQVAQVCTTQPEIAALNLVLLEDDKHLQPAQNLVPLATTALADAAPADFEETLNAIQATLTTDALTELGVSINIDHEGIADVATTFLQDNGLI